MIKEQHLKLSRELAHITSYSSDYFSLDVKQDSDFIYIEMLCAGSTVNTRDLPHTFKILELELPSVIKTKCYNKRNLPFEKEVQETELGHLFEHILLQYLCEEKMDAGYKTAVFSGRTKWDWEVDPFGTFHIFIWPGHFRKKYIFMLALEKTIKLTEMIIGYSPSIYSVKEIMLEETMSK